VGGRTGSSQIEENFARLIGYRRLVASFAVRTPLGKPSGGGDILYGFLPISPCAAANPDEIARFDRQKNV
jgi:hypothetical protein